MRLALLALATGALTLHPAQADVLQARCDVELAVAGIGGGKTHIGAFKTILRAIDQPTRLDQCHAVVSPTFSMSKLGPEPKLLELLLNKGLFPVSPLVRVAKSERSLFLKNRAGTLSRIRIFSGDDPDRWRGDEWLSLWADEGDYLSPYGWMVGQGRLARTNGPAIVTTSPAASGWVGEEAEDCTVVVERRGYRLLMSPDGRKILVQWASTENPFVSAAGYERLRQQLDPETYDREVNAQFIGKTGRVYKPFDRAKHVLERPLPGGTAPIYWGQDFNVERMASAIFHDVAPTEPEKPAGLHQFDELELRDANTYSLVEAMRRWCKERNIDARRIRVIPDASGAKRQTAATDTARSDLRILEKAGFRVDAARANPHVKDRVNCVNGLFYHGRDSLSPRCTLTIRALERQVYDDDGAPKKDGELDNRADAHGYVCWYRHPLRQRTSIGKRVA